MRKTERLDIRIDPKSKRELHALAQVFDKPCSEIIRDLINEKAASILTGDVKQPAA